MVELDQLGDLFGSDAMSAQAMVMTISRTIGDDPGLAPQVMASLRTRFAALEEPPNDVPPEEIAAWKQRRGYRLEELLAGVTALEGLDPSPSYRGRGEQIDGLFVLAGRYFLLETKWHERELPASEVFAFWGKVEGKLAGTLGIFVSMSGFSQEAASALALGKAMKILLVDGRDIKAVFNGDTTWSRLVEMKLRRAAQRGELYYTWQRFNDERSA